MLSESSPRAWKSTSSYLTPARLYACLMDNPPIDIVLRWFALLLQPKPHAGAERFRFQWFAKYHIIWKKNQLSMRFLRFVHITHVWKEHTSKTISDAAWNLCIPEFVVFFQTQTQRPVLQNCSVCLSQNGKLSAWLLARMLITGSNILSEKSDYL
jgi:hypothetical protein